MLQVAPRDFGLPEAQAGIAADIVTLLLLDHLAHRENAALVNHEKGSIDEILATVSGRASLSRIHRDLALPKVAPFALLRKLGDGAGSRSRFTTSCSRHGRSGTASDRLEDPALRGSQGCRFVFLPASSPALRSPGLQQAGLWDRTVCHQELSINDSPCHNKGNPRSAVATVVSSRRRIAVGIPVCERAVTLHWR